MFQKKKKLPTKEIDVALEKGRGKKHIDGLSGPIEVHSHNGLILGFDCVYRATHWARPARLTPGRRRWTLWSAPTPSAIFYCRATVTCAASSVQTRSPVRPHKLQNRYANIRTFTRAIPHQDSAVASFWYFPIGICKPTLSRARCRLAGPPPPFTTDCMMEAWQPRCRQSTSDDVLTYEHSAYLIWFHYSCTAKISFITNLWKLWLSVISCGFPDLVI